MTNPTSSKFDDDDVNDDELLAACVEVTSKKPDPIVPTGNSRKEFSHYEIFFFILVVEVASFGFPFEPYPIQVDFMHGLYSTIYQHKHGIFESPTGTVIYY